MCVRENEMDLYSTMRKVLNCCSSCKWFYIQWIYLQANTLEEGVEDPDEQKMRDYFHSSSYNWTDYISVLRHLRVDRLGLFVLIR